MQIKLLFSLTEPLTVPLGYQYALQSLIYRILQIGNPDYSEFLHSEGYEGERSTLKLFTFGKIHGKSKASRTHLTFFDEIGFEVRCFHEDFCDSFIRGIEKTRTFELNHCPIILEDVSITEAQITSRKIQIEMESPLTVHMTTYEGDKKKTFYLNPLNHEIQALINNNLKSKIAAAFNAYSDEKVEFLCDSLNKSDKVVTTFKNKIYITAWNGRYTLKGHPNVLTLLYNTGIGDRNSQGFGMFNIL